MRRFCLALAWMLLLPLSFFPQSSEAFVFRKIVYSSPVEGLIHWGGKPLDELIVTRFLRSGGFEGGEYKDRATTNFTGEFKFGVVEQRRFFRPDLLSAHPHVSQSIEVEFEGQPYSIWSYQKPDFDLGTESDSGILRIDCDLSKFEQNSYGRIVRCKHNGVRQYE